MFKTHSSALQSASRKALGAIAIGFLLTQATDASALPLTWDLSAIGLSATAFTADALKADEVSHITFTGPTTWFEHGYARITGILNNGVESVPTGLNSTYTLYFDFSGTGDLATGHFATASMTLYAVNGASTFGIDGSNNAFVDNGTNTPVAIATNSLIDGLTGGAPGGDLSAELWTVFSPTVDGAPVFLSPTLPWEFYGHFFHPVSEPGGVTPVADGIVLNGGDDTLFFVPEPASWLLLVGGVPALLGFRRRHS